MVDLLIKAKTDGVQEIELKDRVGNVKVYNIDSELMVNDNNYQQEFLDQPRKYSFWADKLAIANRQLAGAQQAADLLHAQLYKKHFLELIKSKLRPTKDMVESDILQEQDYQTALSNIEYCAFVVEQLKVVVKAFEHRKDMLIQYGADARKDKDMGD